MRDLAGDIAKTAELLACSVRVEVLLRLTRGPATTGGLAKALELDGSLICHHLRALRKVGLLKTVTGRRHTHELTDRVTVTPNGDGISVSVTENGGVSLAVSYPAPGESGRAGASTNSRASGSCEVKDPSAQRTRTEST